MACVSSTNWLATAATTLLLLRAAPPDQAPTMHCCAVPLVLLLLVLHTHKQRLPWMAWAAVMACRPAWQSLSTHCWTWWSGSTPSCWQQMATARPPSSAGWSRSFRCVRWCHPRGGARTGCVCWSRHPPFSVVTCAALQLTGWLAVALSVHVRCVPPLPFLQDHTIDRLGSAYDHGIDEHGAIIQRSLYLALVSQQAH